MRLHRPQITPSVVISLGALFVALGGTAVAATGDPFLLGKANTADHTTALASTSATGPTLKLVNNQTGSTASALALNVGPGRPPFTTNSTVQVSNLNASKVDGVGSGDLVQGHGYTNSQFVTLPLGYHSHKNLVMGINHIELFCDSTVSRGAEIAIYGQSDQSDYGYWAGYDTYLGNIRGFAVFPPGNYLGFDSDGGTNDTGTYGTTSFEGPVNGIDEITTLNFGGVLMNSECEFQLQAVTTGPLGTVPPRSTATVAGPSRPIGHDVARKAH